MYCPTISCLLGSCLRFSNSEKDEFESEDENITPSDTISEAYNNMWSSIVDQAQQEANFLSGSLTPAEIVGRILNIQLNFQQNWERLRRVQFTSSLPW